MSKGLEALHHPRIKSARVDISAEGKHDIAYMFFDDTKQYATIEKELKEKEKEDDYIKSLEDRIDNIETSYLRDRKALEIIKEHTLYCEDIDCFVFVNITKEVNDLLKEILL